MPQERQPRRTILKALAAAALAPVAGLFSNGGLAAEETDDAALRRRFEYLSQNGNSNCSRAFLDSIATMPAVARLRGSCCSPMDEHRYIEQIKGLRRYKAISLIPADPYDIPAGIAQKVMPHYVITLTAREQVAYDYAMNHSDEKGPCCCQCWRWHVYGGLAKYLIRERGFTGAQVAKVWDLSDGCGGSGEHVH